MKQTDYPTSIPGNKEHSVATTFTLISFPLDAYNFGTKGWPLNHWGGTHISLFLVDYRYTYFDINCK